jgi:hypothetical protein
MSRLVARTALVFALLHQLIPFAGVSGQEHKPVPAALEGTARDALVQFDKGWKDYTNEPNLGDPRWKLRMETFVRLARAGPAAIPLLEEAARKDSKWSASTRGLAEDCLGLFKKPEWRTALADYDLIKMDSARVGKLAPDFALKDATGTTYGLSQFRDKKIVVLAFVLADT